MVERISSLDDGYQSGDLSVFPEAIDDADVLYEAKNNAQTTLKQSLTYAGKTIIVKDGSSFPNKGLLRIGPAPGKPGNSELVYYDTKQGNIFKELIRGFAGSRRSFWPSSETHVTNAIMAEHHNAIKDAILNIEATIGTSIDPDPASLAGRVKKIEDTHLAPRAVFRAFPKIGPPPLTVSFHNFSEGHIVKFLWDFGDGAQSIERNPIHTYTQEGEFTVKLDAVNSEGGRGIIEKRNYVVVDEEAATPFFYFVPVEGMDRTYRFIDQSDGEILQRSWIFDDGTAITATDPDAHTIEHTYEEAGTYTPSLLLVFSGQRVKKVFLTQSIEVE